ncbi:MAG: 6-phosphogluconolactonase [Miltoncostaeaceae bacterium]|jgi:6-phosphogluconolactonase|nr:6-phosphogluconolactonase [Miltoncostaeaceae bacterium]
MSEPKIIVVKDTAALADEAAARIERVALEGTPDRPVNIALAGGATPRATYQHLAGRCPPWRRIAFFFGDERLVPPDDEGSNYRMANRALLKLTPLDPSQIHRIKGELPPEEAAREAEREVRAAVPGDPWPVFDLVLLGMGPDGHTASLFPGDPAVEERERAMVAVHRPELPQPWRVSMTLPVINAARRVLIVVADGTKAAVVARAIAGDPSIPAGRVRPSAGELVWVLTEDAAADL